MSGSEHVGDDLCAVHAAYHAYLDMQKGNYLKAIGEGKALTALLTALEKTDAELEVLARQQAQLEEEIALMTIKRPTAAQVADVWKNFLALWEKAEEDERAELMDCLVERVEMVEKNYAAMRLAPIAGGIGQQFGTNCRNRAGDAAYHELSAHQNRSAVGRKATFRGAIAGCVIAALLPRLEPCNFLSFLQPFLYQPRCATEKREGLTSGSASTRLWPSLFPCYFPVSSLSSA